MSTNQVLPKSAPLHHNDKTVEKLNVHIYNHLLGVNASKNFDILFLFHSHNLNDPQLSLLKHLHAKFGTYADRTRFALAYYYVNDDDQKSMFFETSHFKDYKKLKTSIVTTAMEIKSFILSMDWTNESHKLVINIARKQRFTFNAFILDKHLETIISKEDTLGKQLNAANIYMLKENVKKIDEPTIDLITSDSYVLKYANIVNHVTYLKEMYFLKRHSFATFTDYRKKRNETSSPDPYQYLAKYSSLKYDTFTKSDAFSEVNHKNRQELPIEMKNEVFEPSANLFLTWAKFHGTRSSGFVWLEILDKSASDTILDIHLTAQCLAESFNMLGSTLSISIAKMSRIIHGVKYISSVYANQELVKASIVYPGQSTCEAMECFTHYTYAKTNEKLLVIDLRTLQTNNGAFLITEPVVFSQILDRFGASDLGLCGIRHFKSEHKCNHFCQEMGLKSFA